MKRRLIVNADGFGFAFALNKAIFETLKAGVVRSVSITPNFEAAKEAKRLSEEFPHVSTGIHFNLAVGRPVLPKEKVPSLVDDEGNFLDQKFVSALRSGRISKRECLLELSAQVEVLKDLGVKLTHWDGHRNQHLYPIYFDAAVEVAKKAGIERMRALRPYYFYGRPPALSDTLRAYGTPKRAIKQGIRLLWEFRAKRAGFRMADRLITPIDGPEENRKTERSMWEALFRWLPPGTSEVFCHPGYVDETVRRYAKYVYQRVAEAAVLSDPTLREVAEREGVELISFHDI